MDKKRYVQICPSCGSINVRSDLSKEMIAWGGSTRMECNDCGHSAMFFPEIAEEEIDGFRAKTKIKSKEQKTIEKEVVKSKGINRKGGIFWGIFLFVCGLFILKIFLSLGGILIAAFASGLPLVIGAILILKGIEK